LPHGSGLRPNGEFIALDRLTVGATGTLGRVVVEGPSRDEASFGDLAVATAPDSRGVLRLEGAHVLANSFAIGGPAGSQGVVNLVGDPANPDATFLAADSQGLLADSSVGGPSGAAAEELVVPTGTLELYHARVKARKRFKETARQGGKIKLKRTGDTSAPLVVSYVVGGTAQSAVDYEALPGTIEIPARKKSVTLVVRPLADGLLEGPETIELEVVPGEAYAPGAVSAATIELLSRDE
jgi:hypothetical protein